MIAEIKRTTSIKTSFLISILSISTNNFYIFIQKLFYHKFNSDDY